MYLVSISRPFIIAIAFCVASTGCQVEAPRLQPVGKRDQERQRVEQLLSNTLDSVGKSTNLFRSITATGSRLLGQERGRDTLSSPLEIPTSTDLIGGAGALTSYDQDTGAFKYDLSSDASLRLAEGGNQLNLSLTGFVQEYEGQPVLLESRLRAVYVHDGRELSFELFYQETEGYMSAARAEIIIDLAELTRLYQAIAGGSGEAANQQGARGKLHIVVSNDQVSIEGTNVLVEGSSYDVEFASLKISFGASSASEMPNLNVDGVIRNKAGVEVGVIQLFREESGAESKLTFKVTFHEEAA